MTIGKREFTLMAERGKRKYEVAMTIIVASSLLCWQDCVESADFKALMVGVMGLYGAANVITHWAKKNETGTDTSGSA